MLTSPWPARDVDDEGRSEVDPTACKYIMIRHEVGQAEALGYDNTVGTANF